MVIYRRLVQIFLFLALGLVIGRPTANAMAHPLGNFSVNRFTHLELEKEQIRLFYILDLAEIPTFQEKTTIDRDDDGFLSPAEEELYLGQMAIAIQNQLQLSLNGQSVSLTIQEQQLAFLAGQGGLDVLRLTVTFVADVPGSPPWQLDYQDNNYAGRLGWQEIIARPGTDIAILEASVPNESLSQELQNYPQDLLQSPLTVSQATVRFAPAGTVAPTQDQATAPTSPMLDPNRFGGQDQLATLIHIPAGPQALVLAVLVAFGLGAAHALTPGHGKTIVGAYLVGSRGTAGHALFLGLTTTITHTAGVFLFGLLVLFATRFILPEQLYPWLGVLSGLLVVWIGFSLFRGHLQRLRLRPEAAEAGFHYHLGGVGHSHSPDTDKMSWHNLLALGVSGGLLPCPSALILLLSAIAFQRVALGLGLIFVFSLGLASVLTAIGLLMVYAGRLFSRLPGNLSQNRWGRLLPAGSALFITLAGCAITGQALLQTGIL